MKNNTGGMKYVNMLSSSSKWVLYSSTGYAGQGMKQIVATKQRLKSKEALFQLRYGSQTMYEQTEVALHPLQLTCYLHFYLVSVSLIT